MPKRASLSLSVLPGLASVCSRLLPAMQDAGSSPGRPRTLRFEFEHRLDLDARCSRQRGNLIRRASRIRRREGLGEYVVNGFEIGHIREQQRHLDDVVERPAGGFGDGSEVRDHLADLCFEPFAQIARRRIESDLTRQIHGATRPDRLRIRTDRGRRFAGLYGVLAHRRNSNTAPTAPPLRRGPPIAGYSTPRPRYIYAPARTGL